MSTLEVNKITPVSGGTTVQVGESGDTVNIPSGVTIANAGTATGFGITGWSNNGSNNDLLAANANAGIYLGVNSATAANLLDHYEEGTWTPVFNFDQGVSSAFSYSTQAGNYVRVGDLVFASFRITASSGTPNGGGGGAKLDGLPYDVHAGSEFSSWGGGSTHYFANVGGNYQAIYYMARRDFPGTYITGNTSNASTMTYSIPNSDITSNITLSGYITYITDA
jgi:hypothetical protein